MYAFKSIGNAEFGSGSGLVAVDPHGTLGIHYIEIAFPMRRRKLRIFSGVFMI